MQEKVNFSEWITLLWWICDGIINWCNVAWDDNMNNTYIFLTINTLDQFKITFFWLQKHSQNFFNRDFHTWTFLFEFLHRLREYDSHPWPLVVFTYARKKIGSENHCLKILSMKTLHCLMINRKFFLYSESTMIIKVQFQMKMQKFHLQ